MPPRFRLSTELAFLLSGVFIMVVAWALNLVGMISGEADSGHGGADVYLWLTFMFQGLAFSTVGVISANYREFLVNPALAKRYLVGFLLIADGGVHLLAFNNHLGILPAATFFAIVSPVQLLLGIVFPALPPRFDRASLLFTGFLIASFIVTRIVAIWPIGVVEDVDPLGITSKGIELATALTLISLMRARSTKKPSPPPASPADGP